MYTNAAPYVLERNSHHFWNHKRKEVHHLHLPPVHCAAPFAGLSPCGNVPAALWDKGNPASHAGKGRTRGRDPPTNSALPWLAFLSSAGTIVCRVTIPFCSSHCQAWNSLRSSAISLCSSCTGSGCE